MSRNRARTENISTDHLDFYVEEFYCRDNSALTYLGAHDKLMRWQIKIVGLEGFANADAPSGTSGQRFAPLAGQSQEPPTRPGILESMVSQHVDPKAQTAIAHATSTAPSAAALASGTAKLPDAVVPHTVTQRKAIEIRVNKSAVQGKMYGSEVSIEADGANLFPGDRTGKHPTVLKEDFEYTWKFRGTVPYLHHVNTYELNLASFFADGQMAERGWVPCTLVEQRGDGDLEVMAALKEGNPLEETRFPGVKASQIRHKSTSRILEVPEHVLKLIVPKSNPMDARVELDNQKVTHLLGRGPSGDQQSQRVRITVPQDRSSLTVNCGPRQFQHFLSGDILAPEGGSGGKPATKLSRSWILQVGPTVRHEIEIEKKYKSSAIVTLSVDGSVLLEAKAEDFDCPDTWDATFCIFGERYIDWELFETDRWGAKLETQGVMVQPLKYKHSINVTIPNMADLTKAQLTVDEVPYQQLKLHSVHEEASAMTLQADALYLQYKLVTPYKIRLDPQDTRLGQAQVIASSAEAHLRPVSTVLASGGAQLSEAMQPHLATAGQQMGEAFGSLQQKLGEKMGEMFRPTEAAREGGGGYNATQATPAAGTTPAAQATPAAATTPDARRDTEESL